MPKMSKIQKTLQRRTGAALTTAEIERASKEIGAAIPKNPMTKAEKKNAAMRKKAFAKMKKELD